MSSVSIGDHALLSNCHSAALLSREGSVEWLCLPRFDSPSVFGRLLDDQAGHWSIRPVDEFQVTRRYLDDTMVLETTFTTATGSVTVVDALAMGRGPRGHHLGAEAPSLLIRQVEGETGLVELETEYAPRTEYGLIWPLLTQIAGGIEGRGGADVTVLTSPVDLEIAAGVGSGRFGVPAGERLVFALQYGKLGEPAPRVWQQRVLARWLRDTIAAWRSWSKMHQRYQGRWPELVHNSGRVLRALTFYPTGAVVAAPTTSLPEVSGGSRNWDYRFSWVRDSCLAMDAMWVAACPEEAGKFFSYLATAAATSLVRGADLQIMFGVRGNHDLSERELPHLTGWRGCSPVRVGNGAWTQRQIDIYGELLAALYRLRDQISELELEPGTRDFLIAVADTAARRWTDKDQGIWEIRSSEHDFLHSKVMCWVALDRAVKLAGMLGAHDKVEGWKQTRDQIHATVLREGWSEKAGAFTQYFGSDDLDASALMMPLVGFLSASDPRMLATIEAIAEHLTHERGLVYRYDTRGGDLEGREGAFMLCTFWLAHALALADRPRRARQVFERAISYLNDVGLLAEEVDPGTGELLGNFPQAFSHIGLVNAASAISEAETRQALRSAAHAAPDR